MRQHRFQLSPDRLCHKDAPIGQIDFAIVFLHDHSPIHQQVHNAHHAGLGHVQLLGNAAGADIQMRLGDLIDGQEIPQMGCCQFHSITLSYNNVSRFQCYPKLTFFILKKGAGRLDVRPAPSGFY